MTTWIAMTNLATELADEHRESMFDLASERLDVVPSSDGLYFYDSNRGRWNRVEVQDLIRFGEMLSVEPRNAYVCWRATTWTLEMRDGFRPQP